MEWDCIIFLSDTDIDRMGATASREAMRMPISQIPAVSSRAQVGSPLAFPWPNTYEQMQPIVNAEAHQTRNCLDSICVCCLSHTCRKGTMPSRAIACNRRGAPVKLCKPAPQQEKNEPITITQGEGHDRVPITRFPFTESPYLQRKNNYVDDKRCYSQISEDLTNTDSTVWWCF